MLSVSKVLVGGSLESNQAHKLPEQEDRFLFGGVFVLFFGAFLHTTPIQVFHQISPSVKTPCPKGRTTRLPQQTPPPPGATEEAHDLGTHRHAFP